MKRMVFFFVFFSLSLSLLAGTITVTSPSSSDNWMIGTTHDIQWTYAGFSDPSAQTVTIRLWKGNQQVCLIAGGVSLTAGHYSWNLNPNACAGLVAGTYRVRVRIPQAELDDSDDFTISGQVQGTITVTSPNGGERWLTGRTYNIRWASSGISGNVKIILKKGGVNVKTISNSAPNTGSYLWECSGFGSDYKIRIENSAGTTFDESNKNFSIRPEKKLVMANPLIEEVYFLGGVLKAGTKLSLNGKYFGTQPGEILMYGDFPTSPVKFISIKWVSSTQVSGVVPYFSIGQPDQTVEIRVKTADNRLSEPWEMEFEGAKGVKFLSMADVVVLKCDNAANWNYCNPGPGGDCYQTTAICGFHKNKSATVTNDVGADIYQISLKNGWVFKNIQIAEWKKTSGDEVLRDPDPPLPVGESNWTTKIFWNVSPGDYVRYQIGIIVEGPLGTDYK